MYDAAKLVSLFFFFLIKVEINLSKISFAMDSCIICNLEMNLWE